MLTLILSVLFHSGDPCEHMPTRLSRKQTQVCRSITREARKRQLDPTLAAVVAYHETKFQYRIGAAGEIGPLQAMPKYWCPEKGRCDPIDAGLKALAYYLSRHDSTRMALTRYNGAGASARAYAQKVLKIRTEVLARCRPVPIFPDTKEVIEMLGNLAEVLVVAAGEKVQMVPIPYGGQLSTQHFASGSNVYTLREALRPAKKHSGWRKLTDRENQNKYVVLLNGEYSIRSLGDLQELSHADNALVARISELGTISSFLF